MVYAGLPAKDETSETIVRNLLRQFTCIQGYLVGQNSHISQLNHLVNHLNTKLSAETKNQASNRHIFKVLGRLYSLILCG